MTDGRILWVTGGKTHDWLSISGISFSIKRGKLLKLSSGWKPYGGGYQTPRYRTSGDLVVLSGLMRNSSGKWGHVATLPKSAAPKDSLVFNINHHEGTARLNITKDGKVYWGAGAKKYAWISLDGVKHLRNPKTRLKTIGGWKGYGGGYPEPTATRIGDMVYLSVVI
jgi:hypothetical protein